jgi:hypothetical protein
MKRCRRHGVVAHARYRDGQGFRLRCKRCVGEAVTRRHRKVRALLVAEAGGCCANCHGEIESGLIETPPAGAKYAG